MKRKKFRGVEKIMGMIDLRKEDLVNEGFIDAMVTGSEDADKIIKDFREEGFLIRNWEILELGKSGFFSLKPHVIRIHYIKKELKTK